RVFTQTKFARTYPNQINGRDTSAAQGTRAGPQRIKATGKEAPMLERPMTAQRLTQAIVLAALSLLSATNAQAEELRCIGLGANCICSEPLDTPTLVGSTYWWNPADSITKECSGEGASIGGAILRNSAPISSTDATAMAAL